jgi:hypothetical protein
MRWPVIKQKRGHAFPVDLASTASNVSWSVSTRMQLLAQPFNTLAQLLRQARIEGARLGVGRKVRDQGGLSRLGLDLINLLLKIGHGPSAWLQGESAKVSPVTVMASERAVMTLSCSRSGVIASHLF